MSAVSQPCPDVLPDAPPYVAPGSPWHSLQFLDGTRCAAMIYLDEDEPVIQIEADSPGAAEAATQAFYAACADWGLD